LVSEEQNKAIVRRFIEARNTWRLEVLDELVTADCAPRAFARAVSPDQRPAEMTARGPEAWQATLRRWQAAMPDSRVTVEEVLADGDRVMQVELVEGTQTGDLMGIPATGRRVAFRGVRIYELRDGKIVAYAHLWDWLGLFRQLGVPPSLSSLV
jgi:steroid delta-isomerase-like uncharacterized protein